MKFDSNSVEKKSSKSAIEQVLSPSEKEGDGRPRDIVYNEKENFLVVGVFRPKLTLILVNPDNGEWITFL